MGGNLTIFNKDHGTVLAAKHTASLQLLCTVGGNQARSDARTECKILELSLRGGVEAGRAHHCINIVRMLINRLDLLIIREYVK
jgi:hypothetical protein